MNQKIMCSLTATLLVTLGTSASNAGQPGDANQNPKLNQDPALTRSAKPRPVPLVNPDAKLGERSSQTSTNFKPAQNSTAVTAPSPRDSETGSALKDPIKVGERQSSKAIAADREVTAKIYAHDYEGRPAATLYVRNIPVLTFLGSAPAKANGVKIGTQAAQTSRISIADDKSLATPDAPAAATELSAISTASAPNQDDPVLRASALAAQLNQMSRDSLNADKITVSWVAPTGKSDAAKERYRIQLNGTALAVVDAQTILPNSTRNLETDALEATNLMRRLMGDAAPLSSVAGKPKPPTIALGPIRLQLSGFASWYGPGFDGNASASGETFNQNAMTAAHRTLPFGTRVRVTNLDNGASVIVRINDRGPYADDRVIDLSAGAARVVGLINSGVAPVRLDVIDDRQAAASR